MTQVWDKDGNKSAESLDQYITGENPWKVMDQYDAALMRTGVVDGQAHVIVGLLFSSPEAADENAEELGLRWSTARLRLMDGMFDMDEPFNAFCGPLDSRTVLLRDASVLIAKCPMSFYFLSQKDVFFPYSFWWVMLRAQELHFLLPDPVEAVRRLRSGN